VPPVSSFPWWLCALCAAVAAFIVLVSVAVRRSSSI
jgi:hypothetical protein